jgi:uncharacterized protein YndB with AHSA1/START domain
MSEDFVTTRVFDAPRERVWQAWTEADCLKQWFSPRGFKMSRCMLDLRAGGLFHYCLRSPDGKDVWGKWVIREIVKPKKLVFIVSFSDEKGGTTIHPMNPNWPREIHSTVVFEALDAKTKVTVRWGAVERSTELERKTFDDGREDMKQGWGGTLDQLAEYVTGA